MSTWNWLEVSMVTESSVMTPIERIRPLQGIGGLLSVELRIWFPLRAVILVVAGLIVFGIMYAPWSAAPNPSVDPGFGILFFGFLGVWSAILLISAASLSEGAVLGEINRGTAGWLVAMPIRRASVIVAKFVAAGVAYAVIIVGAGVLLYPILAGAVNQGGTGFRAEDVVEVTQSPIGMWGRFADLPDLGRYLGMLAAIWATVVFVIAVMMLLGSVLRSRTAVFGLGMVLVGAIVGSAIVGGTSVSATPAGAVRAVLQIAWGNDVALLMPILSSLLLSIVVLGAAVWFFDRRELA
jgi:ABC-type transport system involved in multi-copper enzyme maturation permease subunit